MRIVHMKDWSLYINAGMSFPKCYAKAELLDTDKGRLHSTFEAQDVTCKECRKLMREGV